MVERFFLAVPQGCLRFVIVVFPDHTHLLFFPENLLWAHKTNDLTLESSYFVEFIKRAGKM